MTSEEIQYLLMSPDGMQNWAEILKEDQKRSKDVEMD